MRSHFLAQVDVFTTSPLPPGTRWASCLVSGLSDADMQRSLDESLSETTFVLPPSEPQRRLPRADLHPGGGAVRSRGTRLLGTCHAWLAMGGCARAGRGGRRPGVRPPGAGADPAERRPIGIRSTAIGAVGGRWTRRTCRARGPAAQGSTAGRDRRCAVRRNNGPGWVAVMLAECRRRATRSRPGSSRTWTSASWDGTRTAAEAAWEVRAFFPEDGATGRGHGHGQPQRVVGAVAPERRLRPGALRRRPGHRPRPARPRAHLAGPGRHDLGGRQDGHLHLRPGRLPSS